MSIQTATAMAAMMALSACASRAVDIYPTYVSPLKYRDYNCDELRGEAARISQRAAIVSGQQNTQAAVDYVALNAGVVLFWPALFLMKGDGATATEVAQLKGEMNAISDVNFDKKCGIVWSSK